jgi:hypothetical protein
MAIQELHLPHAVPAPELAHRDYRFGAVPPQHLHRALQEEVEPPSVLVVPNQVPLRESIWLQARPPAESAPRGSGPAGSAPLEEGTWWDCRIEQVRQTVSVESRRTPE